MKQNPWQKWLLSPITVRLVCAAICALTAYGWLAWNEHQVIAFVQDTGEIPKVVELKSEKLTSDYDGKLVHFIAPLNVLTDIVDPEFAIKTKAVKLTRHVSMLQWQEMKLTNEEKEFIGHQQNTQEFGYQKVWSLDLIGSQRFLAANRSDYSNPTTMPYLSKTFISPKVTMGDYAVSEALLQHLEEGRVLDLAAFDLTQYEGSEDNSIHHDGPNIYLGTDPDQPRIGDQRVEFSVILPQVVSVLASPYHGTLRPYQHRDAKPIAVIRVGEWTAMQLLPKLQQISRVTSWVSRFGALLLLSLAAWIALQTFSKRPMHITALWMGLATECLLFSSLWYRQDSFLAISVVVCAVGMMMVCIRLQSQTTRLA